MPREVVYGPHPESDPIEHAAVGWARDGGVQLGFAAGHPTTIRVDHGGVGGVEDSLWMDLDRAAINHLIRSLRKARDAAYGADA